PEIEDIKIHMARQIWAFAKLEINLQKKRNANK
ncbi:MAG: hypothetical protein RL638_2448, partial [Bacteroidota bacterium]